jgi:predicted RNA binding protein YcfA (HicA-like mRNA interferase family)
MPRIPGIPHLRAVQALEKAGFRVARQGRHIVMTDGRGIVTIPRHDPVDAHTMKVTKRRAEGSAVILVLWAVLICCVAIGSLLPASSPVLAAAGRLGVSDKALHFGAYMALSALPVIGFRDWKRGIAVGLSMVVLGVLMEAVQQFAPGRAAELGDVMANGAGVSCGTLLGLPIRACIALL